MTEGNKRVKRALVELWADGGRFTSYEIAKATAGIIRPKPLSATCVRSYLARWQEEGVGQLQESSKRTGQSAWRFFWGPATATLGDVLTYSFAHMSATDCRKLATALRPFFGLRPRASERSLTEAAAGWTAEALYGLPDRVRSHALQAGLADATAAGYRSVVKRALQVSAEADVVAVVFPQIWEDSPWEKALYRWFRAPHKADVADSTLRVYETYVRRCGEIATELLDGIAPDDITIQHLEESVFPHSVGVMGIPTLPSNVKAGLRYVARIHDEGPYRGVPTKPAGGRGAVGYLYTKSGEAGTADPDVFLRMLEEHGFGEDVIDFFRWYFEYSTLSEDELWERDEEFPARPPKRELSLGTFSKRLIGARAFLYQAMEISKERATPLNLRQVLGENGVVTAKRMEVWWRNRAAAKDVTSRSSAGIEDLLKAVGMIARGAFDRWLFTHQGKAHVDPEKDSNNEIRKHLGALPAEATDLWNLYEHCMNRMKVFQEQRRKSDHGHVNTDLKDPRRIYRETPPAYWVRLQETLLERLHSWKTAKAFRYHALVAQAFLTGLLLSTGVRISEVAWIRICEGGGYGPKARRGRLVTWLAWMRKNEKRHSAYLQDRFCPPWLEEVYLEETRPFFLQRGKESGSLTEEHDFLMVRPSDGNSWSEGWLPQTEKEKKNCNFLIAPKLGTVRTAWQSLLAGIASDLKMRWPTKWGEGAPHAIRISMGYALFLTKGEDAAAHYLGDSVSSVRETYASTDGVHVDVSRLDLEAVGGLRQKEGGPTMEVDLFSRLREENRALKNRNQELEEKVQGVEKQLKERSTAERRFVG